MTCFALGACGSTLPREGEMRPGTFRVKMAEKAAGARRRYLVHIPRGYREGRPLPLVVVLHGAFSSGHEMETVTGLSELADRHGFLVAYPNGIGLLGLFQHWNAGFCCAKAMRDGIDDVGFVTRVVEEVAARLDVDRERVYLVGNSNGGMLAYRMAALRPDLVAGIAVSGATIGARAEDDEQPQLIPDPRGVVPVLIFHGRADDSAPYQGGPAARGGLSLVSARDAATFWVRHNRCPPAPVSEQLRGGAVLHQLWQSDETHTEVVLYSLDGWGHDWPGRHFTDRLDQGEPLRGFDAAEIIWQFFERQHRGSRAD
jgi:polyhydroxybutyrate depolymerase